MDKYDNRGQVSLWKNDTDNPKAPMLKGTYIAHRDIKEGESIDIALWRNDSENPKAPTLKGKGQDRQEQKRDSYESSFEDSLDADIPF